ncbi:MAG TPA: hypothetical protein VKF32_05680 [Thermoanaerobaculia bacterium]|nr:hypothetical protein [Thermoanaerobaculia bacterium]
MRVSVIAGLLALAMAFAGRAAASTNHVVNAHFGSGITGWTTYTQTGYTRGWSSIGRLAAGSASYTADGTVQLNSRLLSQCVGVKPGVLYSYGVWFRYASGFGTPARGAVRIHLFTDGACTNLLPTGYGTVLSSTDVAVADQFQHLSTVITPAAGTLSISVSIDMQTDAVATAKGYFDDVAFDGGTSGDADGNGVRDVNDVFYLINRLFAGGPLPIGPVDVDDSDSVDVTDVFYLINYLFANGSPPK